MKTVHRKAVDALTPAHAAAVLAQATPHGPRYVLIETAVWEALKAQYAQPTVKSIDLSCMSRGDEIETATATGCGGVAYTVQIFACGKHGRCHLRGSDVAGATCCRSCRDRTPEPAADPVNAWMKDSAGNDGCNCA